MQERVSEALGTNVGLELGWPDRVLAAWWPWELVLSQAANLTDLKIKRAPRSLAGCPRLPAAVGSGGAWQELATGCRMGCGGPSSAWGWGPNPAPAVEGRAELPWGVCRVISCYCSDNLTGHPDPTTPNKSCYSHQKKKKEIQNSRR